MGRERKTHTHTHTLVSQSGGGGTAVIFSLETECSRGRCGLRAVRCHEVHKKARRNAVE